jgi:uncharacterized membrane-anchored protein YhcB (DUF1043 family)
MEVEGNLREKRNIFGSVISQLTGLVTQEDLNKEIESKKELERKVATLTKHETDMASILGNLRKEIDALYYDEEKAHRKLEFGANMTFIYHSRKDRSMSGKSKK